MLQEGEGGHRQLNRTEQELGPGLDLEYETEMAGAAPEPATYEVICNTLNAMADIENHIPTNQEIEFHSWKKGSQ